MRHQHPLGRGQHGPDAGGFGLGLAAAVTQIGGINHFLLPVTGTGGPKSPRFGNVAVPDLVGKVVKLGAEQTVPDTEHNGAVLVKGEPKGQKMPGW